MKRGRPEKLHPETKEAIIRSLTIGATYRDACEAAGVSYQTMLNWMAKGEKATSGIYYDFFDSVRKAQARARLGYLTTIAKAANEGDWRAALEYLKRRDRETWGDSVDVTSGGEKLKIVNVGIDPDKI